MFQGCCTALVTPFTSDNKVNFEEFGKIIEKQIIGGVSALLFLGTTGESPTLSEREKIDIIKFAVEKIKGRVPVFVGAGCNSTGKTIERIKVYEKLGVDGFLIVSPYYNKATQKGLYLHYKNIADNSTLPIIIYNVPSRTGINIKPETIIKLSHHENIIGLKQANADMQELMDIMQDCDKNFSVYSGEDSLTYLMLCVGAKGVISVASNLYPKYMSKLCKNFFDGNRQKSLEMQLNINPLVKALFSEVNPIPVKYAMNLEGYNVGKPRMPLTEMEKKEEVEKAMQKNYERFEKD